jgi:hypothetical protein
MNAIFLPLYLYVDVWYLLHVVYRYFLDKDLEEGTCYLTHKEAIEYYTLPYAWLSISYARVLYMMM